MGESSRLVSFEPLLPHSPVSNSTAATAGNTGCSSHTGSAAARRNGTEERRMVNEGFYGPETIKPPKNPVIFDAAKCIRPWKETLISTSSILRSRFSMKNELFPRVEGNARTDDHPTFREIDHLFDANDQEGGGRDFYFLLCDPTDGRYLSTGPASCDTICRDYRFAVYIRSLYSPFPLPLPFFFFLFHFILPLIERKLNFSPDFRPPPRANSRKSSENARRRWKNRGQERVNSSTCRGYRDFLASNSDYAPMNLDIDCNFTRGLSKLSFTQADARRMRITHRACTPCIRTAAATMRPAIKIYPVWKN